VSFVNEAPVPGQGSRVGTHPAALSLGTEIQISAQDKSFVNFGIAILRGVKLRNINHNYTKLYLILTLVLN
jgi:hypothetical protein